MVSRCFCSRGAFSRSPTNKFIHTHEICTISDGKPCLPCSRATELEARFKKAHDELEKLFDEEVELRKDINREHDRLIHRFPLEITSHIFELSLPNTWHTLDERERLDGTEIAAPLILGAICHQWRTIAWSLPRLWTYLPFIYYRFSLDKDPVPSFKIQIAAEWLSRSGKHPLSIGIYAKDVYDNNRLTWEEVESFKTLVSRVLQPLTTVLNGYSHRWEYIDLEIPTELMRNLRSSTADKMILERLRISEDVYDGSCEFLKGTGDARPFPTFVAFHKFRSVAKIGWENVTDLDAWYLSASELYFVLNHSIKLQHCLVKGSKQSSSESELYTPLLIEGQPLVFHDTLQSLNLKALAFHMRNLLSTMSLPALQNLALGFDDIPFNNLTDLLINCGTCRLTSLHLQGNHASNGLLSNLLTHTPLLEKLRFDVQNNNSYLDSSNLFQLLGRTSTDPHRSFLPELKNLQIELNIVPNLTVFSWRHIADIFGPIQDLGKDKRRPLSSVMVKFKYDDSLKIDADDHLRFLKIAEAGFVLAFQDYYSRPMELRPSM